MIENESIAKLNGFRVRIPDIFRLNDWQLRKFIFFILLTLIAYDGIFLADKFLLEIPILPQLFGFVVLTFIPGFMILRILKIHDIDRAINFLLAVGLSLSFIMTFGLFLNILLPNAGVSKPVSSFPLFYSFNIGTLILLFASYLRDKDFKTSQEFLNVDISPLMLSLLSLLFLSIFGAYFMTFYDSNILILLLLFLLSLVPILIVFNKIPKNLYTLSIFVVSLAILYHINLISTYLWSYDIFPLSYSTNLVIEKGIWESDLRYGAHSLLLMTILAPTYSLLCDLNFIWVFKIIFPFLFSLTPLALYQVYQRFDFGDYKFDSKLVLLPVFGFVFFYGFFKDMPDKQHIAVFFLSLILMLMVTKIPNRVPMAIIFSFSLITSHYGVSYVFMLSLIFALFLFHVWRKEGSLLTPNFTLLFSVLAVAWYMYVAQGVIFESVTHIGDHILSKISAILKPDARSGITYITREMPSITWQIHRIIHIALQSFIAIGMLELLRSIFKRKVKNPELPYLSIAFYSLLAYQITTTYGMGFDRVLQITLVLLSPLALVGCIFVFKVIKRHVCNKEGLKTDFFPIKFFAIFLMIFILFNSGFMFEIVGDTLPPYCIALNKNAGWPIFNEEEVSGVMWLKERGVENVWALSHRDALILSTYYQEASRYYPEMHGEEIPLNTVVYIGNHVLKDERHKDLSSMNKIYSNGGSRVYWKSDIRQ